jgi:chemotaxis protein methyltransferase CheR
MPVMDVRGSLLSIPPRDFKLFRTLIHERTGIWLRDGKEVMLASRLTRRLRHYGLASFGEYYQLLQRGGDSDAEVGELINCVTTNKTSFFREPHHFEFLAKTIVPAIRAAASRDGKSVSIWCAASSTGEEPYTIAMTLLDSLRSPHVGSASAAGWEIRVTASDIDTKVLDTAARGIYQDDALDSVPLDLQKRYLLRGKGEMIDFIKVKEEVANLVHFRRINLMDSAWAVKGPFDAIFFRNALIYFQQDTQDIFLRKMTRLLKPRGYLFLGHSEHIPWLHDILEPLNKTIYRLRDPK